MFKTLIIKAGRVAGRTVNNARLLKPRVKSTLKTSVALYKAGYRNTVDPSLVPVKSKKKRSISAEEILAEFKARYEHNDKNPHGDLHQNPVITKGVYHAS
jgi:hypothetical protein